jgi:transketolase C-terminal domain/subunit
MSWPQRASSRGCSTATIAADVEAILAAARDRRIVTAEEHSVIAPGAAV